MIEIIRNVEILIWKERAGLFIRATILNQNNNNNLTFLSSLVKDVITISQDN